jgi:hypothetical protein
MRFKALSKSTASAKATAKKNKAASKAESKAASKAGNKAKAGASSAAAALASASSGDGAGGAMALDVQSAPPRAVGQNETYPPAPLNKAAGGAAGGGAGGDGSGEVLGVMVPPGTGPSPPAIISKTRTSVKLGWQAPADLENPSMYVNLDIIFSVAKYLH